MLITLRISLISKDITMSFMLRRVPCMHVCVCVCVCVCIYIYIYIYIYDYHKVGMGEAEVVTASRDY